MRRNKRRSADVDITPLIDVLFMLIIFFVLTTSFIQGKIDVDLPNGKGVSSNQDKAIMLTVEKNGLIYWNGQEVTQENVRRLAKEHTGREVLVAGDKDSSYGVVAKVLSILREEGITSAGLLMQGGE
ncbi:MAG: biopolymer transporter ExbD [Synergistaceae bacterium]